MNITQHREADRRQSDEVVAWRRAQLVRAGFAKPLAERIACDGRYDLHGILDLTERGCPPHLALRILAPLEGDEADVVAGD